MGLNYLECSSAKLELGFVYPFLPLPEYCWKVIILLKMLNQALVN